MLEVGRYILLNPVRAHMVDTSGEYLWSSWHCLLGDKEAPIWLAVDQTLLQFGTKRIEAKEKYRQFVLEGVGKSLWGNLKQQVYLGSDLFVAQHLPDPNLEIGDLAEIPAKQKRPKPLPLEEY